MGILENEITQTDWFDLTYGENCEGACDNLKHTLKQTVAKYTKTIPQKRIGKQLLPWFNTALWELMKKRDVALKKSLKSGLETDRLIYKSLRNKVTVQLRKARANYFLDTIRQAKGNSQKLWKTIDKLIGKDHSKNYNTELMINGTLQQDSLAVANHFNTFFIESVSELAHSFNVTEPLLALADDTKVLKLNCTNETKVNKIISTLSNSKAKDHWGLDSIYKKT